MGCDIHAHAEVKINGTWHHYAMPEFHRDYDLFERMAGVRGSESEAIAPPRGIPDDATELTKYDAAHWGSDGHSHSWLNAQEISDLSDWDDKRGNKGFDRSWERYLFGNYYSGFTKYPQERPDGLDDVRFIFWFDN
jgi:hypothetical protein